jgi:hypothetical protein
LASLSLTPVDAAVAICLNHRPLRAQKKRAEARFPLSDLAELGFFAEFLFCIGPLVVFFVIQLLAVRISRKNVEGQADECSSDDANENFTHRNS